MEEDGFIDDTFDDIKPVETTGMSVFCTEFVSGFLARFSGSFQCAKTSCAHQFDLFFTLTKI